jgi:hypothetical protein
MHDHVVLIGELFSVLQVHWLNGNCSKNQTIHTNLYSENVHLTPIVNLSSPPLQISNQNGENCFMTKTVWTNFEKKTCRTSPRPIAQGLLALKREYLNFGPKASLFFFSVHIFVKPQMLVPRRKRLQSATTRNWIENKRFRPQSNQFKLDVDSELNLFMNFVPLFEKIGL